MYLDLSEESKTLRKELRAYFAEIINDEDRRALVDQTEGGPVFDRILRRMGKDGWLGLGWPEEFGGRGENPEALYVFYDEVIRANAPLSLVTLNTVGPALIKHGTQAQKDFFLRPILAGELIFAIGYTEPNAGTDLAALETRARIEGDELVINGNKIFTSAGVFADWVWLAVRTDPDAPTHQAFPWSWCRPIRRGSRSPKFTPWVESALRQPITKMFGYRSPMSSVSSIKGGSSSPTSSTRTCCPGRTRWHRQRTLRRGGRVGKDGTAGDGHVYDIGWVREKLAEVYALLSAADLMNLRLVADVAANTLGGGDSAAAKIFGTEAVVSAYGMLQEVLGAKGLLRPGTPGAVLEGRVENLGRRAQNNTFGGGTNEVMREIVAAKCLGMALAARRRPAAQNEKS